MRKSNWIKKGNMKDKTKLYIPARRKKPLPPNTQVVVKVSSEVYNALVEVYNESTLSMKQIASLMITWSADKVVYTKEEQYE